MRSRKTIATPPGATIREQLEERGMTQKEFSLRMDMSEKHISRLINGEVHLTPDVAFRLECVLGISAKFWNNLESRYREKLVIVEVENHLDADIERLKLYPYNEIAKIGWIEQTRNPVQRVFNLRKFFEVATLGSIDRLSIAYRRTSVTNKSDYVLSVWEQKAKIDARHCVTSPINISMLKDIIPEIRKMTCEVPQDFSPRLKNMLAKCGIALVYLPHITGSFLHGATFNDGKKIVMGLTVRGKDADKFWFSLFHELAHILEGHINKQDELTPEEESFADTFSRNILIPPNDYEDFKKDGNYTVTSIKKFAKHVGIHPGIVVGRLQKEHEIDFTIHNGLKEKYKIS